MATLLALVADLLTTGRFLRAVTGVVTRLATVVALHAVDTFSCHVVRFVSRLFEHVLGVLTGHVAVAAARVASFAGTAAVAAGSVRVAAERTAGLRAVSGNVASFAALCHVSLVCWKRSDPAQSLYLVALSGLATRSSASSTAVTRDVARLTTFVARLVVLHGLRAVTACKS